MAIALPQARPTPSCSEVKVFWFHAGLNYCRSPDNRQLFLGGLWYQSPFLLPWEGRESPNWPWLECYLSCVFTLIAEAQMRLSYLSPEERTSPPPDLRWQSCNSGGGLFSWLHANPGLGTMQVFWYMPAIPGQGKWRQENEEFAVSLGHVVYKSNLE